MSKTCNEENRRLLQNIVNSQELNYEQLVSRYSISPDFKVYDKDELLIHYDVHSFLAPFVILEGKSTGNSYLGLFQHRPRYYFGIVELQENAFYGNVKRNWQSDLIQLISSFLWRDVEEELDMDNPLVREQTIDCPNCSNFAVSVGADFICLDCNNTKTMCFRSDFVNTRRTFYTVYRDQRFLLYVFDDWFSLRIIDRKLDQDPINLELPKTLIAAHSTKWNGEQAGSAIRKVPASLMGFMYRTRDDSGDIHILPTNIMDYLVDQLMNTADVKTE